MDIISLKAIIDNTTLKPNKIDKRDFLGLKAIIDNTTLKQLH